MSINCDRITPKNAPYVTVLKANTMTYVGTNLSTVSFTGASPATLTCTAYISSFGDMWMLALPMALNTNVTGNDSAITSTTAIISDPDQRPENDNWGFYTLIKLTDGPIYTAGTGKVGTDGVVSFYADDGHVFDSATSYTFADVVFYWKKKNN